MAYAEHFAQALEKYRPAAIRLLFIAEAPPALASRRFFYFPHLTNGDTLFLETMKTLYPEEAGFAEPHPNQAATFDARQLRRLKPALLERFTSDGFYLIDAVTHPMPTDATTILKKQVMQAALPELRATVRRLRGKANLPAILIGNVTWSVCVETLRQDGLRILHDEPINHPARGGQQRFRRKLREAMTHYAK